MIEFKLNVAGLEQLNSSLKQIPLRDWTQFWPNVIAVLRGIMSQQLAFGGARGPHGVWPPWAVKGEPGPSGPYKTTYKGTQMLRKTGALYDSLVNESGDTVDERAPDRLRWGTSLPYAVYLQSGTRKMFARPFDSLQPEDQGTIQHSALSWAAALFLQAGFRVARTDTGPGAAGLAGGDSIPNLVDPGAPLSAAVESASPLSEAM